jgi:hypothetical protein
MYEPVRKEINRGVLKQKKEIFKLVSRIKRVWEVEPHLHCSVIGTCLSIKDLRQVVHRLGLKISDEITDYELHRVFVGVVANKNQVSKLVDKFLERKHRAIIARFSKCNDAEALSLLWNQYVKDGDISGAYWAVISHPLLDKELESRVWGEVHMISHVLGATRSVTRQENKKLEKYIVELEEKLCLSKKIYRSRLKNQQLQIDELQKSLRAKEDAERKLAQANNIIFQLRKTSGLDRKDNYIQKLYIAMKQQKNELRSINETKLALDKKLAQAERENMLKEHRFLEIKNENEVLEQMLNQSLNCFGDKETCENRIVFDEKVLCGQKIMYVGGRDNLVAHYRAIVDKMGGIFVHHDGWAQQSLDGLKKNLDSVDIVLCPVDCVSHGACKQIKAACKTRSVPFIPLRSSGLSSLAKGIREYA